jgi:hypothetical protein
MTPLPFWLVIDGDPPRRFYRDLLPAGAIATFGDATIASHALLVAVSGLRNPSTFTGSLDNPAVTVALRNAVGEATALLRVPPLGRAARIIGLQRVVGEADPVLVTHFSGVVRRVQLAADAILEVQA